MAKGSSTSKLGRLMKAPIRALTWARDFYVNSMTSCAGRLSSSTAALGGPGAAAPLRLYSFSSPSGRSFASEEDFRELIRTASSARLESLGLPVRGTAGEQVRRSRSVVVVGRIDEDQPCDVFQEDVKVGSSLLFPRSQSYAPGAGRPVKWTAMGR